MKSKIETMSIQELKNSVLLNRDDDEAFYLLADRLEANEHESELYPVPDTSENIALMETVLRSHIGQLEQNKNL
jgi:hypothetical protein